MNEPIDQGREMSSHQSIEGLTKFTLEQLVDLMNEPFRAIETCMTKPQLKQAAKKTLAQNLLLQAQTNSLRNDNIRLKEENRDLKREIMELRDVARRG